MGNKNKYLLRNKKKHHIELKCANNILIDRKPDISNISARSNRNEFLC